MTTPHQAAATSGQPGVSVEPFPGERCWCCGVPADWRSPWSGLSWCFPCKYVDPGCNGPCSPNADCRPDDHARAVGILGDTYCVLCDYWYFDGADPRQT